MFGCGYRGTPYGGSGRAPILGLVPYTHPLASNQLVRLLEGPQKPPFLSVLLACYTHIIMILILL